MLEPSQLWRAVTNEVAAAAMGVPVTKMKVLAFVIGGLREIGEPARKALIVDLAEPHLRARSACAFPRLLRPGAWAPRRRWRRAASRMPSASPSA